MKKTILCILAVLLAIQAYSASGKRENVMEKKKVYSMGESYGVDSSKVSHRSFPKRLVMPKGAMGVGIQFLWAQMDASNVQALAMVTGLSGRASFGNVSPSFLYAYANNNAVGARFSYSNIGLALNSGSLKLISDDISFTLDALATRMNIYGFSVFNRSWFGLDSKGRFALFADVDLGYSHGDTHFSNGKEYTNKIGLSFSPGVEIFVMNNLSLYLSLSFANLSFDKSISYKWDEESKRWLISGTNDKFNCQVRLNVLDLHFGLSYYF